MVRRLFGLWVGLFVFWALGGCDDKSKRVTANADPSAAPSEAASTAATAAPVELSIVYGSEKKTWFE